MESDTDLALAWSHAMPIAGAVSDGDQAILVDFLRCRFAMAVYGGIGRHGVTGSS